MLSTPTTEAVMLGWIAEWAERYGVLVHHCRDSRYCTGARGMPDVVIVGRHGVLWVELKSQLRSMSSDQQTWHWTLRAAGARVVVWLPSHFRNGAAEAAIAALGVTGDGRSADPPDFPTRPGG